MFSIKTTKITYQLPDADVVYFPSFSSEKDSDIIFNQLLNNTHWQEDEIKVFGKTYLQPRLTALYGDHGKSYKYSNITMHPIPFNETIIEIKKAVEAIAETTFTSCLLNLYRNGQDSNGWHADNEKELGKNPIIASVSFGETRLFKLKHRKLPVKQDILLTHGSLLIMKGATQHHWLHTIPKTKKQKSERINLTFRTIF
ncbi:Alkylated DNA repair dioxygenase AlkB [Pustulibacterium marinum]|uniref:Alkylated DNA repair dioxygenase AlkB n=1 Tax=Pustulibacterium marinum TaxID=1224947 RepID=A0A1I7F8S9_9FLAO|nr:alpha-ketoglutarate-dependent dioxygenase AlkB [Pustulibacterium marinum]SFU32535.1 Alkylated DNA repair dioxygenase AlkB [Pustulibacterium marinum]